MISFCQFGAGRIGAIHAANIAAHPKARLHTIVDTDREAAERPDVFQHASGTPSIDSGLRRKPSGRCRLNEGIDKLGASSQCGNIQGIEDEC